jgi:DNA-binding beta-propeller fold protein YncE
MKRFLWLGFVLFVYVTCTGCGDTFRPIIIPNPPQFPNPAAAHTVVSINDNGTVVGGSAMVIDVSGDTDVSVANVGLAPVHAVQQTANQVLVVNHSVTGAAADSLTKLDFSSTTINSTNTISLPPNSAPTFVATTETNQAYVLMPSYVPDPINNPGVVVPSIAVVNTASNSIVATIPVGNNPVAMAETPNGQKLYVANQGGGTISGFNTVDRSARTVSGSLTSAPIWLTARSDSQRVYVLEQTTGTLASVDTTSTAGPDPLTETGISVPGASIMVYDPNLNRLYIPGGQQMAIVDVSQSPPQLLATITIPPFAVLPSPTSVPATAVAAAALPDGSRAYVASYATLTSQLTISSISGDGTNATYAYTLTAGHDLTPGASITVTGTDSTQVTGFDGAFLVSAIVSGTTACPGTCFQVPNTTMLAATPVSGSGTGSNIFPQVTAVWATSNTIKTTVGIPGFPDATDPNTPMYYAAACVPPAPPTPYRATFRFMMAAGGDSSRAYLSSCDGGNVNIIDTSSDTYLSNLPAPVGTRAPIPPNPLNPSQNSVFLIAGP